MGSKFESARMLAMSLFLLLLTRPELTSGSAEAEAIFLVRPRYPMHMLMRPIAHMMRPVHKGMRVLMRPVRYGAEAISGNFMRGVHYMFDGRHRHHRRPRPDYGAPAFSYEPPLYEPHNHYKAPVTSYDAPTSSYEAPTNSYKAPTSDYKPPSSHYKAPKGAYEAPSDDYRAPSNGHHAPSNGHHAPSNDYRAPRGEYEAPIGNDKETTSDYKPPSNDYKAPTDSYKAPTNSYKAPSNDYKAPTDSYKAPTNSYKAPSNDYQAPTSNYEAPHSDHRARPDHTHRVPNGDFRAPKFLDPLPTYSKTTSGHSSDSLPEYKKQIGHGGDTRPATVYGGGIEDGYGAPLAAPVLAYTPVTYTKPLESYATAYDTYLDDDTENEGPLPVYLKPVGHTYYKAASLPPVVFRAPYNHKDSDKNKSTDHKTGTYYKPLTESPKSSDFHLSKSLSKPDLLPTLKELIPSATTESNNVFLSPLANTIDELPVYTGHLRDRNKDDAI